MKMSTGTGIAGIAAIATLGSAMVIMAGCSSQAQVAAVVNGENLEEDTITTYIQEYREANDMTDDETWAQYLVDSGTDADSLRSDTIDYYTRLMVIEQDAKDKGITVSDEEIDNQLTEIKDYYGYDDETFQEQIENAGYTQDSYREYIRQCLISEKLQDATSEEVEASDDEILEMANDYSAVLDGAKRFRCIVMETSDSTKAADVQKQAAEAADNDAFDAIADENSVSTDYDGWDVLVSIDDAIYDTVEGMSVGQVSDVLTGTDYLFIVRVEEECNVGDDGFTSIDQVPEAFKEEFKENIVSSAKSTAYSTYVDNLVDSAEVTVNPKPEGLPYDVSTEGIEATNANSTSSTDNSTIVLDSDGNVVDTSDGTVEVTSDETTESTDSTDNANTTE